MSSWPKIWQIARRLLYQNRWIYLLLLLFPFGMAAIVLAPDTHPAIEDVFAVLHQECLYGLALVAFTGAALLGNEQRSRRIVAVLSRAVSRRQYFLALFTAAWLPLFAYTVSFVISGSFLLQVFSRPFRLVFALGVVQVVVGMWTAAAALFFSTWLPMMLASPAALGSLAILGSIGYRWPWFIPGRILLTLMQGNLGEAARLLREPAGFALLAAGAALLLGAGLTIFERRDLKLKSD
jgi:ABC-type transport system involved in multi-copper enzyme maturation permease subunit